MMRRWLWRGGFAAAFVLLVAACGTSVVPSASPQLPSIDTHLDTWPTAVVTIDRADDVAVTLPVWVADTPRRRARGLMHVADLPDDTGMVFVYDEPQRGGFWMKDTLVALDIAFVASSGDIVATARMVPCPADPCPVTDPGVTYRSALEVPAGWLDEHGIAVGDRLRWSSTSTSG